MSVTGKRGVGIPIILLHDGEGAIVTVELMNGEVYRGMLDEAEDNMNCVLRECQKTDSNGKKSSVELVYIKGTQIAFIVLPDMLSKAPMFKRISLWKKHRGNVPLLGSGQPKGQSAAIQRAQMAGRGRSHQARFGGGPPGPGRGEPGGRG